MKGKKDLSKHEVTLSELMEEEIRIFDKDRIEVIFKFQSEYEEVCKYMESREKVETLRNNGGGTNSEKK